MNLIFEIFNPSAHQKPGAYPLSPVLVLRATIKSQESSTSTDLGPYLATDIEIDECADRVVRLINETRSMAKLELAAAARRQLSKRET